MYNHCLLIDTSNKWITAALLKDEEKIYDLSEKGERQAFDLLYLKIQQLLEKATLKSPKWIVVVVGPGSMIGTRIGVSTARNLSQLWDIPVLPVKSLSFYSYDCSKKKKEDKFAIMLDAKQNRVYASFFSSHQQSYLDITIKDIDPQVFLKEIGGACPIYSDSAESIKKYSLPQDTRILEKPSASNLYELALELLSEQKNPPLLLPWHKITPLYMRAML